MQICEGPSECRARRQQAQHQRAAMKKLLLSGIAALLLATGTAHAEDGWAVEPLAMCYPDLAGGTLRGDSEHFRSAPRTSRPPYGRLMVPENRVHGSV